MLKGYFRKSFRINLKVIHTYQIVAIYNIALLLRFVLDKKNKSSTHEKKRSKNLYFVVGFFNFYIICGEIVKDIVFIFNMYVILKMTIKSLLNFTKSTTYLLFYYFPPTSHWMTRNWIYYLNPVYSITLNLET
jgi:hypothetical protein